MTYQPSFCVSIEILISVFSFSVVVSAPCAPHAQPLAGPLSAGALTKVFDVVDISGHGAGSAVALLSGSILGLLDKRVDLLECFCVSGHDGVCDSKHSGRAEGRVSWKRVVSVKELGSWDGGETMKHSGVCEEEKKKGRGTAYEGFHTVGGGTGDSHLITAPCPNPIGVGRASVLANAGNLPPPTRAW